MARSPWTDRAERRELPAASLDSRRADVVESPRAYTVADLQAAYARESAVLDVNDNNDDAAARVARLIGR